MPFYSSHVCMHTNHIAEWRDNMAL